MPQGSKFALPYHSIQKRIFSQIGRKNKIELNQPRSMEKKLLVGWLTPEILTNFNLARQLF
jgi:hypothetical protein